LFENGKRNGEGVFYPKGGRSEKQIYLNGEKKK
jgi:hypothetical protein